ncbi:MAG: response regulator, partial [Pseudomonadota bacterium]
MSESIRVFLVEDQIRILESLLQILSASPQVQVCGSAGSGEEALEAIPSARPEVLLCDLGLPGIDGIELTRSVRERWPEIEVLVLT